MSKINGPVNLVRMEGKINNIDKVFYLFMDYHVDPIAQTECEDIRSVHIRNYLVDTFDILKGTDQTCDFFLETFPDVSTYKTNYTSNYLEQLRSAFEKIFEFEFEKNKVVKSKNFPNIRLHYMDIRPYFTFAVGDPFGTIGKIGGFIHSNKCNMLYLNDLMKMQNGLDILNSQLKTIHDIFFDKQNQNSHHKIIKKFDGKFVNYQGTEAEEMIKYLVDKIKNIYVNSNVKKTMNQLIVTELTIMFDKYIELFNKLYKYIETTKTTLDHKFYDKTYANDKPTYFGFVQSELSYNIMNNITKIYNDLEITVVQLYVTIMDLYFLRRALDKDYVTNSLVYTGAFHSANYIKFLINKFDFKITHVYYSEIKDINKLNKKIKGMTDTDQILDIFTPSKLNQCIDVSTFPKNFK